MEFNSGLKSILNSQIALGILKAASEYLHKSDWPSLSDINQMECLNHQIVSGAGVPIRFAKHPTTRARGFDTLYQARIFLKGEVSTRLNNWHDFFNALIWPSFPLLKAYINQRHFFIFDENSDFPWTKAVPQRTREQDALTIFDEGGAIVVVRQQSFLDELKKMDSLQKKHAIANNIGKNIQIFFFGHAIYEILVLNMHPDLLASGIWLVADFGYFDLPISNQVQIADERATQWIKQKGALLQPKDFLGVPVNGLYTIPLSKTFYSSMGFS